MDPEWIMDLAFLVDVTGHLNMLNFKNLVINETFDIIWAFEARLQLWADQLQQGCCTHFENLNEAKAVSLGIFDLSKFSRKVISIQNEFKSRFVAFRQHEEMFILSCYSAIPLQSGLRLLTVLSSWS